MDYRGNKTIMCSVLFLDIVAYSKKSVSAQIAQKELFNTMLASAIHEVPVSDRVILDTGDGAAVTFLGDIEDALKAVLLFRESLLSDGAAMDPPLQVCMGINLGPVRVVKDINGRPNIVGDGINVAQRIMGFSKPEQILVSRSYFDAASRLSQEYAGMFYSEGARTDKHVREHEVYAIAMPGDVARTQKIGENTLGLAMKRNNIAHDAKNNLLSFVDSFQKATTKQRALYAGIAFSALVLLIVLSVKIFSGSDTPEFVEQMENADLLSVSQPGATILASAASNVASASSVEDSSLSTKDETDSSKHRTAKSTHKKTKVITATAVLNIAVSPWGEVYLDGKKQGVSPPLDVLKVSAGSHKIEFRNTTFKPLIMTIKVGPNEQMKIKHKFGS